MKIDMLEKKAMDGENGRIMLPGLVEFGVSYLFVPRNSFSIYVRPSSCNACRNLQNNIPLVSEVHLRIMHFMVKLKWCEFIHWLNHTKCHQTTFTLCSVLTIVSSVNYAKFSNKPNSHIQCFSFDFILLGVFR